MLVRPRVFAVPHLSGPVMSPGMAQACDPWGMPGDCNHCAADFSCNPFGELGCIDTTYTGGCSAGFTVLMVGVRLMIAPAPGPT